MNAKKIGRHLVIVLLITLFLWPISYTIVRKSMPFEVAETFIRTSSAIKTALGDVSVVSLTPLGFVTGFGFSGEPAYLDLKVVGNGSTGVVEVDLVNSNGKWRVVKARLSTLDKRKVDIAL